jgi:LacI family transcriptional regulator
VAAQLPLADVTAIVLGHHESANGALLYLQDAGLGWPEQISLVMIGTPEWSGMLRPGLTCVKRPESEMGTAAASLLFEKLRDPNHLAVQQIFPCSLLEGGSVRSLI